MNRNKSDLSDIHHYDDIIDMPRPDIKRHTRMPLSDRAAQFKPFAALTGYSDVIREISRFTEPGVILDEQEKSVINRKLLIIKDNLAKHPEVEITFFLPDTRKQGGSYHSVKERVVKIDDYNDYLILEDGTLINFEAIIHLNIVSGTLSPNRFD